MLRNCPHDVNMGRIPVKSPLLIKAAVALVKWLAGDLPKPDTTPYQFTNVLTFDELTANHLRKFLGLSGKGTVRHNDACVTLMVRPACVHFLHRGITNWTLPALRLYSNALRDVLDDEIHALIAALTRVLHLISQRIEHSFEMTLEVEACHVVDFSIDQFVEF